MKKIFILRRKDILDNAIEYLESNFYEGIDQLHYLKLTIDIYSKNKSRDQEEKYHAQIADIAKQYKLWGRLWDAEDMKRILIDQFKRDTINDDDFKELWDKVTPVQVIPSMDGNGLVYLGAQSRRFPLKLASVFIEWLYQFGAENDIKWSFKNEAV
jgi:hypothetical protein